VADEEEEPAHCGGAAAAEDEEGEGGPQVVAPLMVATVLSFRLISSKVFQPEFEALQIEHWTGPHSTDRTRRIAQHSPAFGSFTLWPGEPESMSEQ
jgi:hypothetical protein